MNKPIIEIDVHGLGTLDALREIQKESQSGGDRRVETYPFARDAVRDAVYNAIGHNCFMFGTPVQIRVKRKQ